MIFAIINNRPWSFILFCFWFTWILNFNIWVFKSELSLWKIDKMWSSNIFDSKNNISYVFWKISQKKVNIYTSGLLQFFNFNSTVFKTFKIDKMRIFFRVKWKVNRISIIWNFCHRTIFKRENSFYQSIYCRRFLKNRLNLFRVQTIRSFMDFTTLRNQSNAIK